jgi:hypothetical protein
MNEKFEWKREFMKNLHREKLKFFKKFNIFRGVINIEEETLKKKEFSRGGQENKIKLVSIKSPL